MSDKVSSSEPGGPSGVDLPPGYHSRIVSGDSPPSKCWTKSAVWNREGPVVLVSYQGSRPESSAATRRLQNAGQSQQYGTGKAQWRWSATRLPGPNSLPGLPGLAAVAVVVAAVIVGSPVVTAATAAVADQEQQNDDPPPVVAAEPVADTAVVVTTHKNTSENELELCRSFHGIPPSEKCAPGCPGRQFENGSTAVIPHHRAFPIRYLRGQSTEKCLPCRGGTSASFLTGFSGHPPERSWKRSFHP